MATVTTLNVMTLGPQQKAMASLVQPTPNATNCVIVTAPQQISSHLTSPHQNAKTVLVQQKRPIAPADTRTTVVMSSSSSTSSTATSTSSSSSADMLRCKRRINFSNSTHLSYSGMPGHQPASVARRNARERNRVKQVNNGFATLRSHIPLSVCAALASPSSSSGSNSGRGASKKLSKVETLRLALEYIRSLQQMLDDHAAETSSTTSSTPEPSGTVVGASSDPGYYSSSPESTSTLVSTVSHHYPHQHHPQLLPQQALSPPCSEASSSPTPSYASESSGSASYASASVYQQESYENYEPMSPEDEELLDVISWWQQSQ
ncbi:achaete-scute homolog 1a [Anabrus simplex]|uniref:achaete-scute homolog 1a n=1 Tax=Anabrus simplex TaxID=316456 RepID=UPI0034DD043F